MHSEQCHEFRSSFLIHSPCFTGTASMVGAFDSSQLLNASPYAVNLLSKLVDTKIPDKRPHQLTARLSLLYSGHQWTVYETVGFVSYMTTRSVARHPSTGCSFRDQLHPVFLLGTAFSHHQHNVFLNSAIIRSFPIHPSTGFSLTRVFPADDPSGSQESNTRG